MSSLRVVFQRVCVFLTNVERNFYASIGTNGSIEYGLEPVFLPAATPMTSHDDEPEPMNKRSILEEIFGSGILWAVPRNRRSLERRHTRNRCQWKLLKPQNNLKLCHTCGHYHEVHTICGICYQKVKLETKAIQEQIAQEWELDAVDKEVVVVYDNDEKNEEFWNGKRIVEMKRERPSWFHNNLQVLTRNPDPSKENTIVPSKTIIPQVK